MLRDVYGADAALWMRRWRWFFLATAGLFGHAERQRMGRQPLPDGESLAAIVQRRSLRRKFASAVITSVP